MGLIKFLAALLGQPLQDEPFLAGDGAEPSADGAHERFKYYNTFSLRDGHLLAGELRAHDIPFEVSFDDGIDDIHLSKTNYGGGAQMSLYVEDAYRDILDDFVKLHFHL